MDEENKKINLESFFKKVDSVEQVANSALSRANSNLGIINNQKALIESLSVSIEAMQTKVRDIANYIIVEKKLEADREEDRRLEAEDAEQKRRMDERAAAMGETGPQGEPGKPAEPQGGGGNFFGGLLKALLAGGALIAAAKFLAPVIIPFIGKTLAPALGGLLTKVIGGALTFITSKVGAFIAAGSGISILGVKLGFFEKIGNGITDLGGKAKSFIGDTIKKIFTPNAFSKENTQGVGSNLGVGGSISSMEDTLGEKGLIENEEESFEESLENAGQASDEVLDKQKEGQERMQKINDAFFKLKEGKITQEEYDKIVEENSKEGGYTETFPNEGGKSEFSFSESADGSESNIKKSYEGTINRFDMDTGKAYILGTEVTADGYNEMLALPEGDRTNIEKLKPIVEEHRVDKLKVEVQKKDDLDLSLKQNLETTDKLTNAVSYQSGVENKDQNSSVVVQNKPAKTTIASIKKTNSNIAFIKATKNQYLSINETELPPEVARYIT